ncbi:hypothetical protein V1511DRAFT_513688 [Dipodascopsis uninucleata]
MYCSQDEEDCLNKHHFEADILALKSEYFNMLKAITLAPLTDAVSREVDIETFESLRVRLSISEHGWKIEHIESSDGSSKSDQYLSLVGTRYEDVKDALMLLSDSFRGIWHQTLFSKLEEHSNMRSQ